MPDVKAERLPYARWSAIQSTFKAAFCCLKVMGVFMKDYRKSLKVSMLAMVAAGGTT